MISTIKTYLKTYLKTNYKRGQSQKWWRRENVEIRLEFFESLNGTTDFLLWNSEQGTREWLVFFVIRILLRFNSCLSCTDVSWREVIWSITWTMNAFMRREFILPWNCNLEFCFPCQFEISHGCLYEEGNYWTCRNCAQNAG